MRLTTTATTTTGWGQELSLQLSKLSLQLSCTDCQPCSLSRPISLVRSFGVRTQVVRSVLVLLSPSHLGLDLLDLNQ